MYCFSLAHALMTPGYCKHHIAKDLLYKHDGSALTGHTSQKNTALSDGKKQYNCYQAPCHFPRASPVFTDQNVGDMQMITQMSLTSEHCRPHMVTSALLTSCNCDYSLHEDTIIVLLVCPAISHQHCHPGNARRRIVLM